MPHVDVLGLNYGTPRYEEDIARDPNRLYCGSETMSHGIVDNWEIVKKHHQIIGDFVWTGWDYLGEAGTCGAWDYPEWGGLGLFDGAGTVDATGYKTASNYYMQIEYGTYTKPYIAVKPVSYTGHKYFKGAWRMTNDECGDPIPKEVLDEALECQAVLFGNIGAKKHQNLPREKKPEQALMKMRQGLQVCTNLRPVRLLPELKAFSPLKESIIKDGFDILMVRDVSSGMLAGKHIVGTGESGREASDLEYYNESIIAKTASYAFRRAKHRKNKVTSLDKANVLASSALWRQKVIELSANYPGVILENRYVDTASMDVIREPGVFDVILTSNAYGDIIADELTQLSGTPSLFGSAELAPDGRGIYTPNQLHNPNEALIGQGTVCPVCIFSAVSMLLRYSLNESELARRVDRACHFMLNRHHATEELCLPGDTILTTDEFGDKLCEVLLEMAGD